MSEQLFFDGFEQPQRRSPPPGPPKGPRWFSGRDLLLFLTHLEKKAAVPAARLGREMLDRQGMTARTHANLHNTLLPVGDYAKASPSFLDGLLQAGSAVAKPCFDVVYERVVRWGNGDIGPFVMRPSEGEAEMIDLHDAIQKAVGAVFGFRLDWTCTPHVTLARTPFIDAQAISPIRSSVREFSLVRSIQAEGRHIILGRWALRG